MESLTKRQKEIVRFIEQFTGEHSNAPTIREIAESFGINPNAARSHLQSLSQKGAIEYTPNIARGIKLRLQRPQGIPMYGSVPAGHPFLADENIVDTFEVKRYLSSSDDLFSVTVQGDSMEHILHEGDLVFVDPRKEPRGGEMVIATIDGQPTIKWYARSHNRIELIPENRKYAVIPVTQYQNRFSIDGVVIGLIRALDRKKLDALYAERNAFTRMSKS